MTSPFVTLFILLSNDAGLSSLLMFSLKSGRISSDDDKVPFYLNKFNVLFIFLRTIAERSKGEYSNSILLPSPTRLLKILFATIIWLS